SSVITTSLENASCRRILAMIWRFCRENCTMRWISIFGAVAMTTRQRDRVRLARAFIVGLLSSLVCPVCSAADEAPLKFERSIVLKGPSGRLDHLAIDGHNARLFVANMANNSLDVVDLKAAKLLKQILGQKHIQGIAFAHDLNRIFVGNGES